YPASYFSTDLNFDQDMNVGQLRSASVLYNIYFLEKQPNQLFLRFSQVYDPASNGFQVRDIMVVKDLHCWEMKATYSDYRKELAVVFSLKAVPTEPFGFDPGRGFYFEGFDQLQRQIVQGTGGGY
ncbi:MAG TPA: hypothetical protein VMT55_06110, partial [Candidatus Sulfotelmatobacter sp.]|nr:hypothetical protein [Candidatus Sulfotelmatobacter sp.]